MLKRVVANWYREWHGFSSKVEVCFVGRAKRLEVPTILHGPWPTTKGPTGQTGGEDDDISRVYLFIL
jgi:hypothetical protein